MITDKEKFVHLSGKFNRCKMEKFSVLCAIGHLFESNCIIMLCS